MKKKYTILASVFILLNWYIIPSADYNLDRISLSDIFVQDKFFTKKASLHLLKSIQRQDYQGVQDALQQGADVDVAYPQDCSALKYAVLSGDIRMVRLLLNAGANIVLPDESSLNITAIDIAQELGYDDIANLIRFYFDQGFDYVLK